MPQSTTSPRRAKPRRNRPDKPDKPYADYPLFFHDSGRIAKKIRGNLHYFGRWANVKDGKLVVVDDVEAAAQQAVDDYKDKRDDLQAGRKPRPKGAGGLTVADLSNQYLTAKRRLLDSGEITQRTFGEYYATCARVVDTFGGSRVVSDLTADDFGKLRAILAQSRGPVTLGNEVQRVRMLFKWGFDEGKIDQPIRYGQSFNKPSAKSIRIARAENGSRMFEADELRRILNAARQPMHAVILVAVNCGFGPTDLASLPLTAVDLDCGWITFPRPKTGIARRAKLWPETVKSLRDAIASRPPAEKPEDADLVFLTRRGRRWVRQTDHADESKWTNRSDMLGKEFAALLKPLGINGGRGLYAARHSFQTIAENSRDLPAVKYVMGHVDSSMSGVYRDRVSDERLQGVADVMRAWLWPNPK